MEKGEIIEQGEVLEVFGNPQHPTTESFVRTVIQTSVPESVLRTLSPEGAGRLFKLKFVGGNASEPIIDSLIRKYNVRVNILFANMSEIQNTTLGTLILQIQGEDKDIFRAVEFLGTRGVEIQELREFQSFSAAGDVEEGVEQRKIKEVKAV